jgi:hypothetical protein
VTVLWSPRRLDYTGAELRSHFLLRQFGIEGDGLVAFTGACRVDPAHMRDLEDLLEGSAIAGDRMLHFLGEHFDRDLERMVLRQHLLAALAADEIGRRAGVRIERRGDDLWHRGRKLSISIATLTPVSAVLHFAVNVVTTGVPVRAAGLEELGVAPAPLARAILAAWRGELGSVRSKRCRVRGAP